MNNRSELANCVAQLQQAAQSLTKVAESLSTLFLEESTEPKENKPTVAEQTKPESITLEQVRAVLAEKSRSGHTIEVRALLEAYGVEKLSAIDPKEYPRLLLEASQIGLEDDIDG